MMLECLLLGYLNSVSSYKLNLSLVTNCLRYLDTNAISGHLQRKLKSLRLNSHINLLVRNQPQQHSLFSSLQVSGILTNPNIEYDEFIAALFPHSDLTRAQDKAEIINKIAIDPASLPQRQLLRRRCMSSIALNGFYEAFACAQLLNDLSFAIEVLQKAAQVEPKIQEALMSFLQVAQNSDQKGWPEFDFKSHLASFKPTSKKSNDSLIPKLSFGFDEVPFQYFSVVSKRQTQKQKTEYGSSKNTKSDIDFTLIDETCQVILKAPGRDTVQLLIDQTELDVELMRGKPNPEIINENDKLGQSDDEQMDQEVDEERDLVAYWRCEDSQNYKVLQDIGPNALDLECNHLNWSIKRNKQYEPLELEDKWGKACDANFSFELQDKLKFKNSYKSLRCFTFELWLKFQGSDSDVTLLDVPTFLLVGIIENTVQVTEIDQPTQTQRIAFDLKGWVHFAVIYKNDITVIVQSEACETTLTFKTALKLRFQPSPDVAILGAKEKGVMATELRLWKRTLTAQQLKAMRSVPLAILFDRKCQLNILINKKKALDQSHINTILFRGQSPVSQTIVEFLDQQEAEQPKKKVGGLKFTSKFDQKKPDREVSVPEVALQPSLDFFGFSQPQKGLDTAQSEFVEFQFASSSLPSNISFDLHVSNSNHAEFQTPQIEHFRSGFVDFGATLEKPQQFIGFDFNAVQDQAQFSFTQQAPDIQMSSAIEFTGFEFQSVQTEEQKHPVQKFEDQALLKVGLEVCQPVSIPEKLSSIEDLIIASQLDEARARIDIDLELSRVQASQVTSQEQMKATKQMIRDLVLLRLTCDLAQQIADIKQRLVDDFNQFQQTNLVSRMASLANVLILLKLPEKMRPAFFKFAIKQNIKVRNFAAALKIVQFWQKQLNCEDLVAQAKIQEYEAICRKNNSQNYTPYHGFDCPACGANLSFGLATPQCGKCKVRIGICYKSLAPILKTDCFKCHVCLAEFSSENLDQGQKIMCPICNLVQVKMSPN